MTLSGHTQPAVSTMSDITASTLVFATLLKSESLVSGLGTKPGGVSTPNVWDETRREIINDDRGMPQSFSLATIRGQVQP